MHAPLRLLCSVALFALALAGCDEQESDPPEVVGFAELNTNVFEKKCTFACHSGGEFAAGGLDLEHDPYSVLVEAAPKAVQCAGTPMNLIEPGDPDASLLYLKIMAKIEGTEAPCGEVMPPGDDYAPLTDDEAEAIRAWIEAGAPRE